MSAGKSIWPRVVAAREAACGVLLALGALALADGARASVQLTQFSVEPTPPPAPVPTKPTVQPRGIRPLTAGGGGNLDPTQQYGDLIRSQTDVGALDDKLLGETVDYYTGRTDFVATDASLPGNFALPVAVSRRYHVANQAGGQLQGAFGDWDLDIPHVEGVVATSMGWEGLSDGVYTPYECSAFDMLPPASVTTTLSGGGTVTSSIPGTEYNNGFAVVIPGKGRNEILRSPYIPGNPDPVTTNNWWVSSCSRLTYYPPGTKTVEGFNVVTPDGVTYDFNEYSYRTYPSYQRQADTSQSGVMAVLPRQQVWLVPTTITDRFGNWVSYNYTTINGGFLTPSQITSSDGRTITINYTNSLVSSITDGTRTWTYSYTSGSLSKVTLPDGSYWSINFANLDTAAWSYSGASCTSLPAPTYAGGLSSSGTATGTIQHPTGASGTFTFAVTRRGVSGAPGTCLQNSTGMQFAAVEPSVYDVLALTGKSITGPHITTLNWSLAYGGCTSSSCSSNVTTTLTDARNYQTLYTFGAAYNTDADLDTEGQLQSVQSGGSGGSYLRTDSYTYFTASGQAYPSVVGTPAQVRGDLAPLSTIRPISNRTTTVNGATYTQTMSNPDSFGYAQTITRVGTDSKTETLVYNQNTSAWILGTIQSITSNNGSGNGFGGGGTTEFSQSLNANELPTEIDRFGRKDKTFAYYSDGNVQWMEDGDNNETQYTSYYRGIPQNIQYANGESESVAVSNIGGITSITSAGATTSYGHDAMGRVSSISPPGSYSATSINWTTGTSGWTRTQTRGSYTKTDKYDAFLHSIETDEPARTVTRSFDADGRNTFTSYPSSTYGNTSVYDGLGRLSKQTDGGGYTTIYTPGANSLSVQDRNGNTTTYRYKTYDQPSTAWPVSIANPIYTTTIGRDTWGKPTSIARGSLTRTLNYNSNQLLYTVVEPETGTTTYTYDNAANIKTINHNGVSTETRGYDPRNRLTSISYSTGDPGASFGWTPDNLPSAAARGNVSRTWNYDTGRLLKSVVVAIGSTNYTLTYGYNTNAQLQSIEYPDATSVSLNPDAYGRPQQVGNYVTGVSYYPNGAIDGFTFAVYGSHTSGQDPYRQLPTLSRDDPSIDSLSYSYDGNANPTQVTDNLTGKYTKSLTYDAANRLSGADNSPLWGNETFGYDNFDNLTSDAIGYTTTNFNINGSSNLLASYGPSSTAVSYDGQGNVKQIGTGTYTFNAANLLTQSTQGTYTYAYTYDAGGTRASETTTSTVAVGNTVNSVYDDAGRLLYEVTTATADPDRIFASGFEVPAPPLTTTKYYYLGSHLVAKEANNGGTTTDTYIHTDALGSPIAQTNANRAIIGTTSYLPYGGLYASTGTGNQAGIGYAGQYNDATGLVYMHARYYSPTLHRFLSPDPVYVDASTALNFNRYSYALNSPYANYDPSGRESACFYDGKTNPCDYHDPNAPQWAAGTLTVGSFFFGGEAIYAGVILEDAGASFLYGQLSNDLTLASFLVDQSPTNTGNIVINNEVATLQANGLSQSAVGGLVDFGNFVELWSKVVYGLRAEAKG